MALGDRLAAPDRLTAHAALPFSHLHHVAEDGIDCRYCHTSVENSPYTGIPSSDVRMSCHSQLFRTVPMFAVLHTSVSTGERLHWHEVNELPDFVYFNHSTDPRVQEALLTRYGLNMRRWLADCSTCHR